MQVNTNENCDYDFSNEREILLKANGLLNITINDILENSKTETTKINVRNKGIIGNIIEEHWFGFKPNNLPEPDFKEAGIELKIIPLIEDKDKKLKVKERTKVCSIKYEKLLKEEWETSHAKLKLNKILFVYYHYNKDSIAESRVKKIDLWELKDNDALIIKNDWKRVHKKVQEGRAHELSETISKTLAASRSGSGGLKKDGTPKDAVFQPIRIYSESALKRAFSLKQSFTNQRWLEINKEKYESVLDILSTNPDELESEIINKISEFSGLTLGNIAKKFNIKTPEGKNAAATIVKKAIGFKSVNSRIKEFEQLGIQVKIIPIREKDLRPWEGVSFPAFKFKELIEERFHEGEDNLGNKWEKCTLLQDLNRILFIPILRKDRYGIPIKERTIGKPFFWSPNKNDLKVIEKEWHNYINEIKAGIKVKTVPWGKGTREENSLTKQSDTEILHIRPHAQDSKDRDEDHFGTTITKQSFWLNVDFVQSLLREEYSIN